METSGASITFDETPISGGIWNKLDYRVRLTCTKLNSLQLRALLTEGSDVIPSRT